MLCAVSLAAGCSRPELAVPPAAAEPVKPVVAATSYPLAYFAERLASGLTEVVFPVPAGEDPAYWQPSEAQIAIFQGADLILLNGADYERGLRTATLPEDRMIDTSRAFADAYLRSPHAVTHSHGPEGAHEHGMTDFNTWLDPPQALRQAGAVRDALVRLRPASRAAVEAGFEALSADLAALDGALREASAAWVGRPLLASHPVYAYAARRYGWTLESVHWEPGEMPPEPEWAALHDLLKKHPAAAMLWEDEPLPAVAERLRGLGLAAVVFRPCGNRPPQGDYLSEMRANARRLLEAAAGKPKGG
jgi:zinc transport system substrate-binding protein